MGSFAYGGPTGSYGFWMQPSLDGRIGFLQPGRHSRRLQDA
jgi:hypothetical protein